MSSAFDSDDDPTVTLQIVKAINEVAREYPAVRGTVVTTETMPLGAYAYAVEGKIAVNDLYTSDPQTIQQMMEADVKEGFHPSLGRCTGPQFLAYHEAAHLIDRGDGREARTELVEKFGSGYKMHGKLSGYSFSSRGFFAPGEALAEAYAAVRCNGGNSFEQEIYRLLTS